MIIQIQHLLPQIIEKPDKITISDKCRVLIKCNCGKIVNTSIRNLCRKWSNKQYCCKSCDIKTYRNTEEYKQKWLKSYTTGLTPERRTQLSNNAKQGWTQERRKETSELLKHRNKHDQSIMTGHIKGHEEWLKKHGKEKYQEMAKLGHEKLREMLKDNWQFRIKMSQNFKINDPIVRAKIRCSPAFLTKEKWQNLDYRRKMAEVISNMPTISSIQVKLYDILDKLNIKYNKEIVVGFYTIDCHIPKQYGMTNEILVEVQGDYWHNLSKTINKDQQKADFIHKYYPQYILKYLWEHEFKNESRIVNYVKYWVGLSIKSIKNIKFNDITQKIIDVKDAELFVGKYHYAGRLGRSKINLGYFYKDELIATIIYTNPIRQEVTKRLDIKYDSALELSRMCIHPDYQINNLASYIISKSILYIKKNYDIKCLVSFSDMTYNHIGIIYKASNWKLDGVVNNSYWYVDKQSFVYHKKTIWDRAKRINTTESEYAKENLLTKIIGFKKYRYIYWINK